jgi:hypothetical protein
MLPCVARQHHWAGVPPQCCAGHRHLCTPLLSAAAAAHVARLQTKAVDLTPFPGVKAQGIISSELFPGRLYIVSVCCGVAHSRVCTLVRAQAGSRFLRV